MSMTHYSAGESLWQNNEDKDKRRYDKKLIHICHLPGEFL
jgi:hypothetical protein